MKRESAMVTTALARLPYLLPGCHVWRNNTGTAWVGQRLVRFGEPGSADILCCWRGWFIAIECKSDKGRQSAAQKLWAKKIEYAGGVYWVARRTEDLNDLVRHISTRSGDYDRMLQLEAGALAMSTQT